MSQPEQFDNFDNVDNVNNFDNQENDEKNAYGAEEAAGDGMRDTHGLFSGGQNDFAANQAPQGGNYGNDPQTGGYGSNPQTGGSPYGNSAYGNGGQPINGYNNNYDNRYNPDAGYGNNQQGGYGGNPQNGNYGNGPQSGGYGGNPQNGNYGNGPQGGGYGGNLQAGGDPYGNAGYGNNLQNGNYGNSAQTGSYGSNPQTGSPYGNSAYGGGAQTGGYGYGNGQYGNNGYGGQPYGNAPYNNPYSPLAAPQKKSKTGLIVGIVVAVIVLFLVAIFALAYKAVKLVAEEKETGSRNSRGGYDFDYDNDYDNDYDYGGDNDNDYDYDYDYDYGDDNGGYDFDYGNGDTYDYDNDEYYTLHDDIKDNLSYSVDFEYYEYDTDYENVEILVSYPVITGENIPNLEKINAAIAAETEYLTDYFEEEYIDYYTDEDGFFSAFSAGYVAYMDEKKMSVVFSESVYSDYYNLAYLYCVNIDMENGVVLDNEQMLSIDDDFSVEFRKKSDVQNGEISYLTGMTDQQITGYFNSPDIIVFYTPQGMEIGFNYEDGWVTVTYDEYEQYLKVF